MPNWTIDSAKLDFEGYLPKAANFFRQARSLMVARENPLAAAAGGYLLVASNLACDDWSFWVDELSNAAPHMSDGAKAIQGMPSIEQAGFCPAHPLGSIGLEMHMAEAPTLDRDQLVIVHDMLRSWSVGQISASNAVAIMELDDEEGAL